LRARIFLARVDLTLAARFAIMHARLPGSPSKEE
jgi:hypothetical protein